MSIVEEMNIIESLSDQIEALLDLMMLSDGDSISIRSIHTASEMVLTMEMELMQAVHKIEDKCYMSEDPE